MFELTFKNNDRIELKNIKHSDFASHETYCYEATLYFNGKKFASVGNDGQGGSDYFHPYNYDDMPTSWNELNDRCKNEIPKEVSEYFPEGLEISLEHWCNDQVTKFLCLRDYRRTIKNKIVYIHKGEMGVFSWKGCKKLTQQHFDVVQKEFKDHQLLNLLPEDEALEIFMKH